jgi:peptidoglycan-N-acetylglucosamine deacetylase
MWVILSIITHLIAMALIIARPHARLLALTLFAANHRLLIIASLMPRGRWLGPNLRCLPPELTGQVALTFDDAPDPEVTPAVLQILAAHSAKATFFCISERARAQPVNVCAILADGHKVENHSHCHAFYSAFLSPYVMAREIARAQMPLATLTGEAPRYFRTPAAMHNHLTGWVLARLGLHLANWTRRGSDTVTRDSTRVLQRLTRNLKAGDILLLHDGTSARDFDGQPVVLKVLPVLLERLARDRLSLFPSRRQERASRFHRWGYNDRC